MNMKITDFVTAMNDICRILEKYKGVFVPYGGIDLSKSKEYLILKPQDMKEHNMPYAAKKILKKYPEIRTVHFTGGWMEHVYTRETLKWMGVAK